TCCHRNVLLKTNCHAETGHRSNGSYPLTWPCTTTASTICGQAEVASTQSPQPPWNGARSFFVSALSAGRAADDKGEESDSEDDDAWDTEIATGAGRDGLGSNGLGSSRTNSDG